MTSSRHSAPVALAPISTLPVPAAATPALPCPITKLLKPSAKLRNSCVSRLSTFSVSACSGEPSAICSDTVVGSSVTMPWPRNIDSLMLRSISSACSHASPAVPSPAVPLSVTLEPATKNSCDAPRTIRSPPLVIVTPFLKMTLPVALMIRLPSMVTASSNTTSCAVAGVPALSAPMTRSAPPPESVIAPLKVTLPVALMRRSPAMLTRFSNTTSMACATVMPLSRSVLPLSGPSFSPAATTPLKVTLPPAWRVSISPEAVAGSPPTKFFSPAGKSRSGRPRVMLPAAVMVCAPVMRAESASR